MILLSFYDLANLEIDHPQLIIRRYRESDFSQLNAIFDPEYFVWFFTNYKSCREFIQEKIQEYQKANLVMLVIIDKLTGEIIGTSSLYEISLRHKRLEMGSTWL
ncbi:MAG: hypothetical protein RLZZ293_1049, partial [Pseudomonadota bacterium]